MQINPLKSITKFSSGTKDYIVSVSESENGPWQKIKTGTLKDPRTLGSLPQNTETFPVDPVDAGYVKFECTSYYEKSCALQFIGVSGGNYHFTIQYLRPHSPWGMLGVSPLLTSHGSQKRAKKS